MWDPWPYALPRRVYLLSSVFNMLGAQSCVLRKYMKLQNKPYCIAMKKNISRHCVWASPGSAGHLYSSATVADWLTVTTEPLSSIVTIIYTVILSSFIQ